MTFTHGTHFGNRCVPIPSESFGPPRCFPRSRFSQIGTKKNVGPIFKSLFQRCPERRERERERKPRCIKKTHARVVSPCVPRALFRRKYYISKERRYTRTFVRRDACNPNFEPNCSLDSRTINRWSCDARVLIRDDKDAVIRKELQQMYVPMTRWQFCYTEVIIRRININCNNCWIYVYYKY